MREAFRRYPRTLSLSLAFQGQTLGFAPILSFYVSDDKGKAQVVAQALLAGPDRAAIQALIDTFQIYCPLECNAPDLMAAFNNYYSQFGNEQFTYNFYTFIENNVLTYENAILLNTIKKNASAIVIPWHLSSDPCNYKQH